jgi:YcxB-like protein
MQITFELTEQDFVNAYKTHCSRGPSSKWRGAIWVCFLVIFLGVIFHSIATNMSDLSRYVPLAILAIAWFVLIRWLQLFNMRKQFRKQPGAHGPRTVVFDSAGAHWRWDGGSNEMTWKNYIRWVQGNKQILFYTSPASFDILPTGNMEAAQLAELREMLKTNIHSES